MSRTGDAIIYLSEIEGLQDYEFLQEIFLSLSHSEKFEKVNKVGQKAFFYDITAIEQLKGNEKSNVGFHFKRISLLSCDVVQQIHLQWQNCEYKTEKLYIITDESVQYEAYNLAESLSMEIWSGFSLYLLKYPNRRVNKKKPTKEEELSEALKTVVAGKTEWINYQRLSCDIFTHLFCPPLDTPRFEYADKERRNRRDMVFENSSNHPYWKILRNIYKADYVVIDAKNYSTCIDKHAVLEIAHYLKAYGCGLFGIILTRYGSDESAKHAIKEQWISGNKLIIVLNDIDLFDMLKMKSIGKNPEEVIRLKIADFRMSL